MNRRNLGVSRLLFAVMAIGTACALIPAGKRALGALKNRTAIPAAADFEPAVTVAALLQSGDDTHRWSVTKAARIEGYVAAVRQAGIESANRFSLTRRDTHIEVALRPDAPTKERVIVEVTPPIRDWARTRGVDWSTATLQRTLVARRCRFEGWLFFDSEHVGESENTNPGAAANWRGTAWEIHPITSITVVN